MPRRRRETQGNLTALILVLVLAAAVYYTVTGADPLGIFSAFNAGVGTALAPLGTQGAPGLPSTQAAPATGVGGTPGATWWEVYFTDPTHINKPDQWQDSIEGRLIDRIKAAKSSIHIASFEFDLTPVAEALIAAKQRGVDVRWVTDDESGIEADKDPGRGQFAMLQKAGIQVRDDGRTALMHDKFWIFDSQIVWTGSTNITANGVFKQNNNTIVIHSADVAAMYEREFAEMWDGKFGPSSPSTLSQQSTVVQGTPIQVVFASEDDALEKAIIPRVEGAKTSIRFLAFSFTDDPLAAAMIARAQQGVDVSGVFEKVGSDTQFASMYPLKCAGVPVRQDGNPSFLHHKVIIIDNSTVITGSLNFSANADESNDENVIILENADIASLYSQEFERMWAQGHDPAAHACK